MYVGHQRHNQIIQFDGIDSVVAGTQLTYGLNNRFFAKRSQAPGAPAQSREIIDVSLTQSYYNNPVASVYDHQYQTTGLTTPTNYSPIALSVRALPTNDFNATVSAEIDSHYLELRTISVQGSYSGPAASRPRSAGASLSPACPVSTHKTSRHHQHVVQHTQRYKSRR